MGGGGGGGGEEDEAATLHIVVFPWLAFGHIIPLLELSKSLARKGHRVTFISTPRNLQRLPAAVTPLVDFVSFPLPQVDGLPPDAESTTDVLPHQIQFLKKAFDGLATAFSDFLDGHASATTSSSTSEGKRKPDWIVVDFSHHWAPPMAARYGIPCAYFSVIPVSAIAFFGTTSEMKDATRTRSAAEDYLRTPEWISKIGASLCYRPHEADIAMNFYRPNASGVTDGQRFGLTLEGCKLIAPRSCFEFESNWLHLLMDLLRKPVVPVGLLPPEMPDDGLEANRGAEVFDWLAQRSPSSVVYVALGSEAMLSADLVRELALGLERSQVPFLWALRWPTAAEGVVGADQLLPQGFEERVRDRGLVVMGWVPQHRVLAHASVGGFLTHCGWGSVVEGLHFGRPFVMLPLAIEQGLNAQLLDKKIGREVERDGRDGSFDGDGVTKAVRAVMVGEEGREYRRRAAELAAGVFDKETHERCFDEFVRYLKDHAKDEGVEA